MDEERRRQEHSDWLGDIVHYAVNHISGALTRPAGPAQRPQAADEYLQHSNKHVVAIKDH